MVLLPICIFNKKIMRSKALHFRHFSATRAIKKKDDSQIGRKPVIGEEFSPNVKKSVDPKGLPAAFEQRSAALPLQTAPPESISKFYPASPAFEGEESSSAGISSSSNPSLRLNFDSSRYVDMLKAEGFSDAEANGLISLISEVVEDSMQASTTSLVPKGEQRRYLDECLKDLKLIKADVSNLEFRDFANLKKSIEQIKTEVEVSKTGMATDLSRIHAGARLDMNLEKSRYCLS